MTTTSDDEQRQTVLDIIEAIGRGDRLSVRMLLAHRSPEEFAGILVEAAGMVLVLATELGGERHAMHMVYRAADILREAEGDA